ncbi:hypothetical protein GWI33_015630 [Rhynchophorus ferrugineus]|uniref:Uncharacterized protein n=1 Tax=Rhynchophorus ferrugineus TaxID=354439 RepID=A0A834M5T6_RHYFE|nr:hypothetical protein GWI33_015630 [Rhynchophorus ferrugineus]
MNVLLYLVKAYEPIEDDELRNIDIDQPNNQEENNNVLINSESQQSSCAENDDSIGSRSKNKNYAQKSQQKPFASLKEIPKKTENKRGSSNYCGLLSFVSIKPKCFW